MTSTSDPILVGIFTLAKDRLARGDSNYICTAIEGIRESGHRTVPSASLKRAKLLIQYRLGSCFTLTSWIRLHHPELDEAVHADRCNNGPKMRATRIAWLDSLIQEFS